MSSSVHVLAAELDKIKESSDKFIPAKKNYIVALYFTKAQGLAKLAKERLYCNPNHVPDAVYCGNNVIYLLFSCTNGTHYHNGSHQSIISEYCKLYSQHGIDACNIIEVDSKQKIAFYVMYSMMSQFTRMMADNSNGKLTEKNVQQLTINEVKKIYQTNDIPWIKKSPSVRYGEIFKLKEQHNTQVISSFSEKPDFRRYEKFVVAIFGT